AHYHLVVVRVDHLLQVVEIGERLRIVRMQKHEPRPEGRLGKGSSTVLAIRLAEDDAVPGKRVHVGGEVDARVVGSEIIRAHRVHDHDEDVGKRSGSLGKGLNQVGGAGQPRRGNVRVGAQNAAKLCAFEFFRSVAQKTVRQLEGEIL